MDIKYGLVGVNMEKRNNEIILKETEDDTFTSKLKNVSIFLNLDYMNSEEIIHIINKYC